jgi:thiamine kinase
MTNLHLKPIALGRTAEIYAWNESQVLKLFYNWFDLESIQFEQHIAQAVHSAGFPVPLAGDILQINGRNGLIYEYKAGQNIWETLEKQPWRLFALARLTAQLHSEMHSNTFRPDLPSQRRKLERKISNAELFTGSRLEPLHSSIKIAVLDALSNLPDGDRICHGDFHPGNILLTSDGAVVIDWIDASLGNPLADVARTTIIALGAAASSQIPNSAFKIIVRVFHLLYLHNYFQMRPGGEEEYRHWLPVVAAARLSENIPELEHWLLHQTEKLL